MQLTKQLTSFGIIGVINTAIDVGSYTLFIWLGAPLLLAIIVSTSLGLMSSYSLNRLFTFRSHKPAFAGFLAVTLVGLWVLQPVIIFELSAIFSLSSTWQLTAAKLVATAATMVWNFVWYKRKVFA